MRSTCIRSCAVAAWLALAAVACCAAAGGTTAARPCGADRAAPRRQPRCARRLCRSRRDYDGGAFAGGDVNYMLGGGLRPGRLQLLRQFWLRRQLRPVLLPERNVCPAANTCCGARGGMNLPPLVTTSPNGTPQVDAGVLGEDGTEILYGGHTSGSNIRSGGRLTFGRWFDPCQRLGIEGDYFKLEDERTGFTQTSTGDPILARPFYDVTTGQESSELVAFPNVIQGTVSAEHVTRLEGAGVRAMWNLACGDGCGTSCITCCPVPTGYRFDALLGYRVLRLVDDVHVVEDLVSTDTAQPAGAFIVRDSFQTENQFHGVDFGTSLRFCKGCFTLDLLSKLALGNVRSRIDIDGSTVITQKGQAETFQGGLLAQRTNIGSYEFNEFAAVPELGVDRRLSDQPLLAADLRLHVHLLEPRRAGRRHDQPGREPEPAAARRPRRHHAPSPRPAVLLRRLLGPGNELWDRREVVRQRKW